MPAAKKSGNPLSKKIGPAPVWLWIILTVVFWYIYKHFTTTTSANAATMGPGGVNTGTSSAGLGSTSAPASGQGSSADNLNADLLGLLGSFGQNLVDVNTNLANALMSAQSAIAGMGQTALEQEGAIAQMALLMGSGGGSGGTGTKGASGGSSGGNVAPVQYFSWAGPTGAGGQGTSKFQGNPSDPNSWLYTTAGGTQFSGPVAGQAAEFTNWYSQAAPAGVQGLVGIGF